MLKLNKDQKRLPIGGHQFHEKGYTFRGEVFEEVVEKVRKFRLMNGLSVGDPKQEVLGYYAKNWPYMVKEDWGAVADELQPLEFFKWREWITTTWASPPKKMLITKEAEERWKICQKCPFNHKKDWKDTDEARELNKRSFLLRRGNMQVPSFLGFCALHQADLTVFTLLDSPEKFSKKDAKAAGECWCSLEGKAP